MIFPYYMEMGLPVEPILVLVQKMDMVLSQADKTVLIYTCKTLSMFLSQDHN
jgi:hypothetical protein